MKLQGFTNADWAGSPLDGKITSGVIFSVGFIAISWYIKKQGSMAHSSVEVEYMVVSQAACEAMWMRKIILGLFSHDMDLIVIYCDNQGCIKLSENLIFHHNSKHIDIWYHYLWDYM